MEGTQRQQKSWLRECAEAVLPALVIVVIINVFLGQTRRVDGLSMEPNLENNQRIIMEKVSYRFRSPRRGEIIVLRRPDGPYEHPLIKRVVGLPGETIAIHDGAVYIDGQPLAEAYLDQPTLGYLQTMRIPEGCYYVLGDNRASSNDSRSFGVVTREDILGKAWFRYWPPAAIGPVSGSRSSASSVAGRSGLLQEGHLVARVPRSLAALMPKA